MDQSISQIIHQEIQALFQLKKTERLWHIPILAALCSGIPLLTGLYFNNLQAGIAASLGGMVILYMPSTAIANRMITLLTCSFGFMVSFTIGISFSFNPYISSLAFGLFAVFAHWVILYFKTKPPGSFFFITIASISSCIPFQPNTIPARVGLIGLGCMAACIIALLYSLLVIKKHHESEMDSVTVVFTKSKYTNFIEAIIMGCFMFLSLFLGHLLNLQNPYWVPISCVAVMQGASFHLVWQRSLHRILGTFIGLGLCWALLSVSKTPLQICITIIVLQYIIEILVVRHYALAAIFITPMTILLAEAGNPLMVNPDALIAARFWDIALGSIIGAFGGYFIHHEKLRQKAIRSIRKTKIIINRK